MNALFSKPVALIVAATISFVLIVQLVNHHDPSTYPLSATPWRSRRHYPKIPKQLAPVRNATLGFEKVLALNLPTRTDKRDALSLSASLTNISITYVDGVRGEDIMDKSLPYGQESRQMGGKFLGSWRAHLNAIRAIVEDRLSSVLILEDDADWDVRIKDQLVDFARASRAFVGQDEHAGAHSPYGDGWDVLWLGLCHDELPPDDPNPEIYLIEQDITVPLKKNIRAEDGRALLEPYPDHTRLVHRIGAPICSYAYAVSYRGAQKLLWALSVKELRGNFDNALMWWCQGKEHDQRCVSATPTYFHQHRMQGASGRNSDNDMWDPEVSSAYTRSIRWSARLNVERLLTGRRDYVDSYPDHMRDEDPA